MVVFLQAALDGGVRQAHSASKNTSLYRPPTREEINTLKETENLFKSSLFRMQVQLFIYLLLLLLFVVVIQ